MTGEEKIGIAIGAARVSGVVANNLLFLKWNILLFRFLYLLN